MSRNRRLRRLLARIFYVPFVVWVVITLLGCILGALSAIIGGLCGSLAVLLWFITLYWAYEAYQGKYFEIQWLTQFLKSQNWL